jgi:hypothetical protein
MLSFLGLMAFIGFSSVSRGDVYEDPQQPTQQCSPCETYGQYDETVDPQVIVNDMNVQNYVSVDVNVNVDTQRTSWRRGDRRHHRPGYPPGRPMPAPGMAICRVFQVGYAGWNQVADLWIGNQWYQRGPIGVILNSYRYFVSTGQCYPGNGYL